MAQNGAYRSFNGKMYLLVPREYVVAIPHTGVASSIASGFITIDPFAPFLMFDRHMEDSTDPSTAAPGLQGQYENFIQVQDQSQNYSWQNDFVPRSAFARDRTQAYRQAQECLIKENTKLNVTIKEPAAGSTGGTMYITLQGFSLYPVAEQQ